MIALFWGLWATWKASVIKWAIYAVAILSFIGTIWFKGYNTSQRKFKQRQADAKRKQIDSKRKIVHETKNMADDALDRDLDKWMRD